jgi:hypothetical protein
LTDANPNPQSQPPNNRGLLVPWIIAGLLFTVSIIISMYTMIRGMAYARANQAAPPSWFHSLLTFSQYGLFLSTAAVLILVAISLRRAFKRK